MKALLVLAIVLCSQVVLFLTRLSILVQRLGLCQTVLGSLHLEYSLLTATIPMERNIL